MTLHRPTVYGASKMNEASLWRELHSQEKDICWVNRWPYVEANGVQPTPINAEQFWHQDFSDIDRADFILVLPPREGVLRGALVEVGYALARGCRAVLVGDCIDYGSWQYHPMVIKVHTLEAALKFIKGDFR